MYLGVTGYQSGRDKGGWQTDYIFEGGLHHIVIDPRRQTEGIYRPGDAISAGEFNLAGFSIQITVTSDDSECHRDPLDGIAVRIHYQSL